MKLRVSARDSEPWLPWPVPWMVSCTPTAHCSLLAHSPEKLRKEHDIFDVWFESGSSWHAVLQCRSYLKFPCDLYLEGSDQHRGWFQLSLLNSLGAAGQAPFKAVLTHGFAVGPDGKKKSKSDKDYVTATESARQAINGWVSDQTNAKIIDLIGEGDIDSTTRLVLANAIYFNAQWATPFQPSSTHAEAFTRLDGSAVTENGMSQTLETSFAHGDGWQAVQIPYVGDQTAMVLVVPDAGNFPQIEKSLSGDFVQSVFAGLSGANVNVTIPKFTIKGATVHLKDTLEALGMKDAFDPNAADFSKMSVQQKLYVGDVLHQAFVSVDEKGTEAAAATAVVMKAGAAPGDPVSIDANRPFFFFVRDIPTNTVLFVGRVVDPT